MPVTVIEVSDSGDNEHFVWKFSSSVSAVTNMAALMINGVPPTHDFSFSGVTATGGYSVVITPGDPWTVASGPLGVSFANGSTVLPGASGVTT